MHGDTNKTYLVGDVDEESRLLVERTREAMMRAIRAVRPGRQVNVIGRVIESYARRFGYGVVRDFTGHGVGPAFHDGLIIPHFDDPDADTVIEAGMTFTIEPMLTLGTVEWDLWDDGWTATTRDGSRTAQFEHTLLVTADGAEILTLSMSDDPLTVMPATSRTHARREHGREVDRTAAPPRNTMPVRTSCWSSGPAHSWRQYSLRRRPPRPRSPLIAGPGCRDAGGRIAPHRKNAAYPSMFQLNSMLISSRMPTWNRVVTAIATRNDRHETTVSTSPSSSPTVNQSATSHRRPR